MLGLKTSESRLVEYRSFPLVEARVVQRDDGKSRIEGHAAVFNKWSEPLGGFFGSGFRESIAPGAFKKTIKEGDVRALWNHSDFFVLGRSKNKQGATLSLAEDDIGLKIDIDPPDTQLVRDMVLEPIRRGDVDQMSFAFSVVKEQWDESDPKDLKRTLFELSLFDVSPVTFPAYPDTDVAVRSLFSSVGLDYSGLANIMFRSRRGLGLVATDHDLIRASVDALSRLLPGGAVQADTPPVFLTAAEPRQARKLAALLRELELTRLTV